MSKTINYGVDLGTTNSAISRFENGKVSTFSNSQDYGRSTLASIVGYKKGTVVVGNRARVAPEKFAAFKRKMGTTESYKVNSIDQIKTPVDFSAEILKQLKSFTDEKIDSLVITVPASFNSVQSAATKEAAEKAGIKQVVLIQEPIAASLAYANGKKLNDSTFLVYDLGGGTFDVALVNVKDGELKVIDNEGDNFLGGHDFDQMIVDNFVIPSIEKETGKTGLVKEFKSASSPLNKHLFTLLDAAERSKIALSTQDSASVETQIIIDGEEVYVDASITKSEFEGLIKSAVDATCEKINAILTRNSMNSADLDFVLMVGGSTYIPYVRTRTSELLNQEVKTDIDPTTAISIGAAFFAGTKTIDAEISESDNQNSVKVKMGYPKSSKEATEDVFVKVVEGFEDGFTYEIARGDNGFTTGKTTMSEKFDIEVPLVEDAYNAFTFNIFDSTGNKVFGQEFGINSGVSVSGQPLTEDVCIEIDDDNNPGETKLRTLFSKGTTLPNKTKFITTLNKKLVKGDKSDSIHVNIFEGSSSNMALANQLVGSISISGADVHSDVLPGSEIEIRLSCKEDRTYSCEATLLMTDQSFKKVFTSIEDNTNVADLKKDMEDLNNKIDKELKAAEAREDYGTAGALKTAQDKAAVALSQAKELSSDDVTSKKNQLEKERKMLAQSISDALKDKKLKTSIEAFNVEKEEAIEIIGDNGNDSEKTQLNKALESADAIISTKSIDAIDELTSTIATIKFGALRRVPDFIKASFAWLISEQHKMSNQSTASSLITSGKVAAVNGDWNKLSEICQGLGRLLPRDEQMQAASKIGF